MSYRLPSPRTVSGNTRRAIADNAIDDDDSGKRAANGGSTNAGGDGDHATGSAARPGPVKAAHHARFLSDAAAPGLAGLRVPTSVRRAADCDRPPPEPGSLTAEFVKEWDKQIAQTHKPVSRERSLAATLAGVKDNFDPRWHAFIDAIPVMTQIDVDTALAHTRQKLTGPDDHYFIAVSPDWDLDAGQSAQWDDYAEAPVQLQSRRPALR